MRRRGVGGSNAKVISGVRATPLETLRQIA
jgi:hypothetical protein